MKEWQVACTPLRAKSSEILTQWMPTLKKNVPVKFQITILDSLSWTLKNAHFFIRSAFIVQYEDIGRYETGKEMQETCSREVVEQNCVYYPNVRKKSRTN